MTQNLKQNRSGGLLRRTGLLGWLTNSTSGTFRRIDLQMLEERVLYSATPLPINADAVDDASPQTIDANLDHIDAALIAGLGPESTTSDTGSLAAPHDTASLDAGLDNLDSLLQQLDHPDNTDSHANNQLAGDSAVAESGPRHEVVFLQSTLYDLDQLTADLFGNDAHDRVIDVIVLDQYQNGFEQIDAALSQVTNVDSIHFVTHGAGGFIQLGSSWLSAHNVGEHYADLARWGMALTEDGDILIYGCDVAASDDGQAFLAQIARLTDADVAASDDLTGSAELGGNWALEHVVGSVDSKVAFSIQIQTAWHGTLAATTGRIGGSIYEDINGDSLLNDAVGAAGVTVYLYRDSDYDGVISNGDTLYATTTTDLSGHYAFNGLLDDTYFVIIDSRTIAPAAGSNTGFSQNDVWAEQTYGSVGAARGAGFQFAAGALFGGRSIGVSDDASSLLTAQHVTRVAVAGSDVDNIDSAFSFAVISTTTDGDDDGSSNRTIQGSLRQFIQNSNAVAGVQTSMFQLHTSDANYDLDGNQGWTIRPISALPIITDAIVLDALTQAGASADAIGGQHQLKVLLDGIDAPATEPGFHIVAGNSIVRGFAIDRFGSPTMVGISAIMLSGEGGNLVETNFLGLDTSGTSGTGNSAGVQILNTTGTLMNRVGGSTAASRNVIANNANGVIIHHHDFGVTTPTLIQGNYIGTDRTGMVAMGNSVAGINVEWIGLDAGMVQIGGLGTGEGNLVSGNARHGIVLNGRGYPVQNVQVLGNMVGVAADGVTALGNQFYAIYIIATQKSGAYAGNNRIEGNVLAASLRGIYATGNVDENQIVNNFIGTDVSGTVDLGNVGAGIYIEATVGGKNPENNVIQNNLIAYNQSNGITLIGGVGNTIHQNSIYSNAGLGIYLYGHTANDGALTPGATNQAIDTATITSADLVGDQLTLAGYVGSAAGKSIFANARVEFFVADPSGQGQMYLGFLTSDANGNYSGTISTYRVDHADKLTATATLTGVGTSEFGNEFGVNVAPHDLTATGMNIDENLANGEIVGTITASDADTGDTASYQLVNDADGRFTIDSSGNVRVLDSSRLDYESQASHDIIVQVTDGAGATFSKTFTITLNDVDEFAVTKPIDVDVTVNFVNENSTAGTLVGITTYSIDNDASNSAVFYTLADSDGGRFAINSATGQVWLVGALDYETDGLVRAIRVLATSADGSTASANFVILVGNVNEAPVAGPVEYSTSYVDELFVSAPGLAVNASDPDGDAISLVLVSRPATGTATLLADGSLRYRPQAGFVGNATLQYYVTDGALASDVRTIVIHVTMPNNVLPPDNGGVGANGGSGGGSGSGGGGGNSGRGTSGGSEGSGAPDPATGHASYGIGTIQATKEDSSFMEMAVAPVLAISDSLSTRSLQTAEFFTFDTLVVESLESADFRHGLNEQELPRLELPKLERHLLAQAQADQSIDILSDQRPDLEFGEGNFIHVDPLVATALGTGLVIWLIHAGQFAAALLSTASGWVQLDPLTVLEGSPKLARAQGEAEASEEIMFEEAKIDRSDA